MLSSVLNSEISVQINIRIMRAFVEIRQLIAVQPEYELLKQTVRRIESRMDVIEGNHLVDQMVMTGKLTQLSKETREFRQEIQRFSEILDDFQDTHLIIKRPEDPLFSQN